PPSAWAIAVLTPERRRPPTIRSQRRDPWFRAARADEVRDLSVATGERRTLAGLVPRPRRLVLAPARRRVPEPSESGGDASHNFRSTDVLETPHCLRSDSRFSPSLPSPARRTSPVATRRTLGPRL